VNAERRLLVALLALTFVTGIVDAISFLGLGHVFTANMTGNVVLLGFALAGATGLSAARSIVSLLAFLAGAVLGGRLGLVMNNGPRRRRIFTTGTVEALLLFVSAAVSVGIAPAADPSPGVLYAVIVLTAFAMGLRTATVRWLAVPDMTTTVLTQVLAALAAESVLAGGTNPRLGRRAAAVVLMLAGAALGVLLMGHGLTLPLAVGGVCTLAAWIHAARTD
jgi:uncharacterized membrane protein YoaK (UPF0700 family)